MQLTYDFEFPLFRPRLGSIGVIVKPAVVLFLQRLNHVIGIVIIRRRNTELFAQLHQHAGEHINFGMPPRVQILQCDGIALRKSPNYIGTDSTGA